MDAALRENLSEGLADGLDKQILNGTNGLFAGTNFLTTRTMLRPPTTLSTATCLICAGIRLTGAMLLWLVIYRWW